MSKLQERIKERRLALDITLAQEAELLGVKEATAQRYESGEIKNIKHDTILNLSKILKCDPAYLMGWTDVPIKLESIPKPTILSMYDSLDETDRIKAISYIDGLLSADKYTPQARIYRAAKSSNNAEDVIERVPQSRIDKLKNAPEDDKL